MKGNDMKNHPHIKSKRWFVREKRKELKVAKKALDGLRSGCAMDIIYGKDTRSMTSAVHKARSALKEIDEITKRLV